MAVFERKTSLAGSALAALLMAGVLGPVCISAVAHALQTLAAPTVTFEARDFAGTWNWIFNGKVFATMILELRGEQFGGSISNGSIELDNEGKIASATPAAGLAEIVKTSIEGNTLHVFTKDGDETTEWALTLKSPQLAEVRVAGPGVPANFQGIRAEKVK